MQKIYIACRHGMTTAEWLNLQVPFGIKTHRNIFFTIRKRPTDRNESHSSADHCSPSRTRPIQMSNKYVALFKDRDDLSRNSSGPWPNNTAQFTSLVNIEWTLNAYFCTLFEHTTNIFLEVVNTKPLKCGALYSLKIILEFVLFHSRK